MIRLAGILRTILEGAKVTFDEKGKPSSIDISIRYTEGEQLNTVNGITTKGGYKVYYSLESDSKAQQVKKAQDALKYQSDLINTKDLKNLLSNTLLSDLPKVDYIVCLESKGDLNKLLADTLKSIYTGAEIIYAEKIEYTDILKAVDWEKVRKASTSMKISLKAWLDKKRKEPGPYKIRKSNEMQSSIAQYFYSKYNFGMHPSGEGDKFPPVYNAIVNCLTGGKKMLIVDDNLYSGDDFRKIFEHISKIKEVFVKENEKPLDKEVEMFAELEKLKQHPKAKTSVHLQNKIKELEEVDRKSVV